MSNELIKAMEWLSWQLAMMYKVDEHNSSWFDAFGSDSQCSVEYDKRNERVVVDITTTTKDYDDEDNLVVSIKQEMEIWEISIDDEDEDGLLGQMESILNYIRRSM